MASAAPSNICYALLPRDLPSSDRLWREGISPVLESPDLRNGLRCALGSDLYDVGVMVEGIRQLLERTAVVIADLTGRNPSVLIQAGLATGMGLPVVFLLADTADMDDVPFDWQGRPIVRYSPADPRAPELRGAVFDAIQKADRPSHVRADVTQLLRDLRSGDRLVRRQAEDGLGHIADPRTIAPLCELLAHDSSSVRVSAGLALRQIGGPEVCAALVTALSDPRTYVRRMVTWVLRGLRDGQAGEPLVERLQDDSALVRQAAAWALGELQELRAAEPLAGLLDDADPNVRQSAAEALGKLGEASSLVALIGALSDPDGMVRQAAATALGMIREPAAVAPLLAAAADEGWLIRQAAARALGAIGDPAAGPALEELLQDANEDVRWAAITGLAEMDTPDSRDVLRHASSDPAQTPFIRGLAAAATVGHSEQLHDDVLAT